MSPYSIRASRHRVACVVLLALAAFVSSASVSSQAPPRHFLWEARSGDAAPPTYLVGSLHVLTKDYYPLSPAIEEAFAASKVLIEEVDLDDLSTPATAMAMIGKAMLADGRTLDQVVSPATWQQVSARAAKAGLPTAAVQRMKPWMAAIALTTPALAQAGFTADLGVDRYFFDKAKAAGHERRALETVAYQVDRFDQMPLAAQESMLKAVLADVDTQLSNVKVIADAWARGDVKALEALLLGAFLESPEMYERLLVERNRNWIAPIARCLQERTACFVVVGAAHLVGPHSVPALLREKGFTVTQR